MRESDKELVMRSVVEKDEELLFDWGNDPLVRQGSFDKDSIPFAEHQAWFREKLNSSQTKMWIMEDAGIPCGLVRMERSNNEATLNYLIAASHRGRRLAHKMLAIALDTTLTEWPGIRVLAYTVPENIASRKSLESAGFELRDSGKEKRCFVYNC